MNVFVLSTGRTGTMSLEKACAFADNYTCAHESRCSFLKDERLQYPEDHIEIDNRLSWFLGKLDDMYGDEAIYIHMLRDTEQVARSYAKRWNRETSIIRAYAYGILKRQEHEIGDTLEISRDYVETVNSNIKNFLRDKTNKMEFRLENAAQDLPIFWEMIRAKGEYNKAWAAFNEVYNTSEQSRSAQEEPMGKLVRVIKKLPAFIRNA
ncbi:MAG: hypothetical protein P8X57_14050 [Cyclobacteriaceae bacterium]